MPKPALPPSTAADIPPPSVDRTLAALFLRTDIRVMSPKKRKLYLRALAEVLAEFESDSNVVRIRGKEYDEAVAQTRKEAAAWLRATLAAFFVSDGERL